MQNFALFLLFMENDTQLPTVNTSILPELTPRQMAFVELISQGNTASEAVRQAYNHKIDVKDVSIWQQATRLNANASVRVWLSAYRQAGAEKGVINNTSHLAELERLKELAIAKGNMGAAVRSEELRGKAAGLYIDRHEHVHKRDNTSLMDKVGEMFGEEFKQKAMSKLGMVDVTPERTEDDGSDLI